MIVLHWRLDDFTYLVQDAEGKPHCLKELLLPICPLESFAVRYPPTYLPNVGRATLIEQQQ